MNTARELFLPGPGAPHWLPAGKPPGGLHYLGWGRRRFGKRPIPQRLHYGWTYMAVMSGSPVLLTGSRRQSIEKGELVIAGPDYPYGWIDRPSSTSTLLVWEWSHPPFFQSTARKNACTFAKTDDVGLADIKDLHIRTRREIQQPDTMSPRLLQSLKDLVDVAFERATGADNDHALRDSQRLKLAEAWMRRHLDVRAPAEALADYLGVSAMTLQRLFRDGAGISPGQAFNEIKMNEAVVLLKQPGSSVKEVAFALGYRHPGDFTRAYKKRFGDTPLHLARA
jgi:AraC-like DNA-binding protein